MNDDDLFDSSKIDAMASGPVSDQLNDVFKDVNKDQLMSNDIKPESDPDSTEAPPAELNEFEIDLGGHELTLSDDSSPVDSPSEDGFELSLNNVELEDSEEELSSSDTEEDQLDELSLDEMDSENFSLGDEEELSLSENSDELGLDSLGDEEDLFATNLNEEEADTDKNDPNDLSLEEDMFLSDNSADFSDDAKKKLEEIDAIMDHDATQASIIKNQDQHESIVPDDLNLESINFSQEIEEDIPSPPTESKKNIKSETEKNKDDGTLNLRKDLKEISGAFSGEIERLQATISNLRTDREELLTKIQKLEEEKLFSSRNHLSLRAELDEKKIELLIMRKKLNEEISELKDRQKLHDEKRLILEEKNKLLSQEVDKATQKNKIDVKKVLLRERELEQKLELLKSDAETQIRHRDLKILELKRKIDAMEFDMESLNLQEKKSVESRYELEEKLEKAIKTLKTAVTVLEDEQNHTEVLKALKKNIDM